MVTRSRHRARGGQVADGFDRVIDLAVELPCRYASMMTANSD
ncbi:MAG TPA: hypothetical protein VMU94_00090 [Streptosporangiaceae bacterium]|nr:hypothetical protein [Streptosporangiaceae bacterium]